MRPIKRFGIAAASNCWMAFQNEPRLMAACRLSKVFSSDGSITASRFMPTLDVRFICLPRAAYSRSRVSFAVSLGCAHSPGDAQQSGNQKGNLSYLAINQPLRECLTHANKTTTQWDNPTY